MPVNIISRGEIAFHWPTQKTNFRDFKVGLDLKTHHVKEYIFKKFKDGRLCKNARVPYICIEI